jgi:hypothetical protein
MTLAPENLELPEPLLAQIPPKALGYRRNRESPPSHAGALFDPLTLAEAAAGHTLSVLLHPERLARLVLQEARDAQQLGVPGLFQRLHSDLLAPRYEGMAGAVHRRSAGVLLQHWRQLYRDGAVAPEVRAEAGQALTRAQRMLSQRARSAGAYGSFYRFEADLIDAALDPEEPVAEPETAPLPPGAPIGSAA